MRENIIEIIKKVGLDDKCFLIGNGAERETSEIHYKPNIKKLNGNNTVEYSIQYYNDVIAIWEIGKRIEKNASVNMCFDKLTWKEINEPLHKSISIQKSSIKTNAAVMPIYYFEYYLRGLCHTNKGESDNDYYLHCEGRKIHIYTTRYERDSKLRKKAIEFHGTKCAICDFSFEEKYGKLGEGFIEVHHKKPISLGEREVDYKKDLVCVCSNCHRMLHKQTDKVFDVDELKTIIKGQVS